MLTHWDENNHDERHTGMRIPTVIVTHWEENTHWVADTLKGEGDTLRGEDPLRRWHTEMRIAIEKVTHWKEKVTHWEENTQYGEGDTLRGEGNTLGFEYSQSWWHTGMRKLTVMGTQFYENTHCDDPRLLIKYCISAKM